MSFDRFKTMITAFAKANGVSVVCRHDTEKGRFIAQCADGLVITGRPSALKLTFQNGRYHTFQTSVADFQKLVA